MGSREVVRCAPPPQGRTVGDMIASMNVDPPTALMLAHLEVDDLGQVRVRGARLRRRQRRFQASARIRRLLA